MAPRSLLLALIFVSVQAAADETAAPAPPPPPAATEEAAKTAAVAPAPQAGGDKKLSGISILGNQETPKALVIVPWKSSEIGDPLGLDDNLDDSRRPVDKEVFLRELDYYDIRSGSR